MELEPTTTGNTAVFQVFVLSRLTWAADACGAGRLDALPAGEHSLNKIGNVWCDQMARSGLHRV